MAEHQGHTEADNAATVERKMVLRFLLRYFLPFVLVMAVVAYGWDWFMQEKVILRTEIHGATKIQRSFSPHPGEVAIVGSSRALNAFIPDSIFPNAFNYGINGVGYAVTDLIIGSLLKHGGNEPIVVSFDYEMGRLFGGDPSNYIALSENAAVREVMAELDYDDPHYYIPGVRFYGGTEDYLREYMNQRVQVAKIASKGASLEIAPFNRERFDANVKERLGKVPLWVPENKLDERFKKRIVENPQRPFIIVISPYHDSYRRSFPKVIYKGIREYLAEMDRLDHVRVLEVTGEGYADTLFANTTHLHYKGAKRFSVELRALLADTGYVFVP